MPFSSKYINKIIMLVLNNKKCDLMSCSLQVSGHEKRVFLSTLKKASVTVEAALVTSVFLMALVPFVAFVGVIKMQMDIEIILDNIARKMAQTVYYEEELLSISKDTETMKKVEQYINDKINIEDENIKKDIYEKINYAAFDSYVYYVFVSEFGVDKLEKSYIKNGALGLDFRKSNYNKEQGIIEIELNYQIYFPFVPMNMGSISAAHKVNTKVWNGSSINSNNEIVYITKSEEVYHLSEKCCHLNIDVEAIKYKDKKVWEETNKVKIRECEVCGIEKYSDEEIVYVTQSGDCFHSSIDCGTISRTVMAIDITEIGERRLCDTCGKNK